MGALFQKLIWPAAAGNVAWAFFTVAVQEKWSDCGVVARLIVLLLLAVYLTNDWMRTAEELPRLKPWYWVGDAFLAVTIVVFAIATQLKMPWLGRSLAAVFLVAILGHLAGAWEPERSKNRLLMRMKPAGINALGLIVVLGWPHCLAEGSLWRLPSAMALVVTLWILKRRKIYAE